MVSTAAVIPSMPPVQTAVVRLRPPTSLTLPMPALLKEWPVQMRLLE